MSLNRTGFSYFVAPPFCGSTLQFLVLDGGFFDAGELLALNDLDEQKPAEDGQQSKE